MTSEIPVTARGWRITSQQYVAVLVEAEDLLKDVRESHRAEVTLGDRRRLDEARERGVVDLEFYEDQVRKAEARADEHEQPRWYLRTKRGRLDRPQGSIRELGPTIDVPDQYSYASVAVKGGDHSIDLTLTSSEVRITLTGTDAKWLKQAERWAQSTLAEYRPRWWWLTLPWVWLVATVIAVVTFYPIAYLLPLTGLSVAAALLLATVVSWGSMAALIVLAVRTRTRIIFAEGQRGAPLVRDVGLLVAGAIIGQVVASVWQLVSALP
jgi:hypothetical protein